MQILKPSQASSSQKPSPSPSLPPVTTAQVLFPYRSAQFLAGITILIRFQRSLVIKIMNHMPPTTARKQIKFKVDESILGCKFIRSFVIIKLDNPQNSDSKIRKHFKLYLPYFDIWVFQQAVFQIKKSRLIGFWIAIGYSQSVSLPKKRKQQKYLKEIIGFINIVLCFYNEKKITFEMNPTQRQYKKQLHRILRLKVSKEIKIQMLYSFQDVLQQHCQIQSIVFNQSFNEISMVKSSHKPIEIQSTKFSESLSIDNVTLISQRDIEELEQHILNKKVVKIQNYEQIESLEEQLYSMEDAIEHKRKYNEQLRKSIDKKMVDIEEQKQRCMDQLETRSQPSKSKHKHNRSFSDYFKSWWN